jgi:23S rRNA pseudouridine1911/1915/1917 synthase
MATTRPEPKIPSVVPVLFEDEDLLIVNKPAHIPVHPGGRYLRNTLIHLLKKQRKLEFLVLSHRLDRETTGVCVLAKTTLAKDKMYWQFFNGDIEKTYLALVWGVPNPPSGLIDKPMGLSTPAQSKIRIKQVINGQDAKTAKTKYHTLGTHWILAPHWAPPDWPALQAATAKKWAGKDLGPWPISLVECRPLTGRTNQIRVHLASIGAGIVGDKLYDPDESVFIGFKDSPAQLQGEAGQDLIKLPKSLMNRLILDSHGLHAKSLKFRHPRTGKTMTVEAPTPDTWRTLMPQLQMKSLKKT